MLDFCVEQKYFILSDIIYISPLYVLSYNYSFYFIHVFKTSDKTKILADCNSWCKVFTLSYFTLNDKSSNGPAHELLVLR